MVKNKIEDLIAFLWEVSLIFFWSCISIDSAVEFVSSSDLKKFSVTVGYTP
jgi:hypothetical protein